MNNKELNFITQNFKNDELDESSITRVWQHINNHDIAIISAGKKFLENCYYNQQSNTNNIPSENGKPLTKRQNNERKKELYSILISLGYSVTKVQGVYIENYLTDKSIETKENSFFVVNIHDDPAFKENIIKIGIYFCQDSVLFKAKKDEEAVLIGTNYATYPGFGNVIKIGKFRAGIESQFMTKVKGRPFTFSEAADYNTAARGMMKRIAKRILEEINKMSGIPNIG